MLRPPAGRLLRIGRHHRGLQAEPVEVLVDPLAALGVDVERQHRQRRTRRRHLQQVRGLAARRGAGIQHPQRLRQIEPVEQQLRGQLGAGVLHRDVAFGEAGDLVDRQRMRQQHALGPHPLRSYIHSMKPTQDAGHGRFLCIDPQHHRRLGVVGAQDVLPLPGMVVLQVVDPPARVVPQGQGLLGGRGDQRFLFPQKAAQAGVDEARLRPHRRAALGGLDRLVDQGEGLVGRILGPPDQRQGGAQQRVGQRRRGAAGQLAAQRLGLAQPAQHMGNQCPCAGPQRRRHRLQRHRRRLAAAHRRQRLGGGLQLLPQGDAVARAGIPVVATGRCVPGCAGSGWGRTLGGACRHIGRAGWNRKSHARSAAGNWPSAAL